MKPGGIKMCSKIETEVSGREPSQMFPQYSTGPLVVFLLLSSLLTFIPPTQSASLSGPQEEGDGFLYYPEDQYEIGLGPIERNVRSNDLNSIKSRIRLLKKRGANLGHLGKIRILKMQLVDPLDLAE